MIVSISNFPDLTADRGACDRVTAGLIGQAPVERSSVVTQLMNSRIITIAGFDCGDGKGLVIDPAGTELESGDRLARSTQFAGADAAGVASRESWAPDAVAISQFPQRSVSVAFVRCAHG